VVIDADVSGSARVGAPLHALLQDLACDNVLWWNARLLSLEEIPLIKGNGRAAVYRWNAALNRWTECHAVLSTPLWPMKPHFFHAALLSQVAIFEHEAVRSGGQRPAATVESTD
jgi:hypothetical protein